MLQSGQQQLNAPLLISCQQQRSALCFLPSLLLNIKKCGLLHQVRVRQTPFEPRFYFAYTDPVKDTDESAHMHEARMIEPTLSQLAVHVLQRVCDPLHPGSRGHLGEPTRWQVLLWQA